MAKTSPADGEARKMALESVVRDVLVHHEAEELTVFPRMLQNAPLKGLALELIVEHEDMRRLFEALKTFQADTEIWKYKLASIYDIMHAHWLKEEEQLTPFGLDYFSEAEWVEFGRRFDQIRAAEKIKKP